MVLAGVAGRRHSCVTAPSGPHGSLASLCCAAGVGFELPRHRFRPRAPDFSQSIEHEAGEARVAARAAAEMNDRIVVPDLDNGLNDFSRW